MKTEDLLLKILGFPNPAEKVGETPETHMVELRDRRVNVEIEKVPEPGVVEYEYPEIPYRPVGELTAFGVERVTATPTFTKVWFDKKRKCNVERVEIEGIEPYYRVVCKERGSNA